MLFRRPRKDLGDWIWGMRGKRMPDFQVSDFVTSLHTPELGSLKIIVYDVFFLQGREYPSSQLEAHTDFRYFIDSRE